MDQENYRIFIPEFADISIDQLESDVASGERVQVLLSLQALQSDNGTEIRIFPQSTLHAETISADKTPLDNLDLRVKKRILLGIDSYEWNVTNGVISLENTDITHETTKAFVSLMQVDIRNASASNFELNTVSENIDLSLFEDKLTLETTSIHLLNDRDLTTAIGQFKLLNVKPDIEFSANLSKLEDEMQFEINTSSPIELSAVSKALLSHLPVQDNDIFISDGLLNSHIRGIISAGEIKSITMQMQFGNTTGNYNGIGFDGLVIDAELSYPVTKDAANSAQSNIREIEYGTAMNNIDMHIQLQKLPNTDSPTVLIESFKGEILGSELESSNFVFNPNSQTAELNLNVSGLDIERVVELQQIEGLTATGKLDGVLPVQLSDKGIQIQGGHFNNQSSGGTIQYKPDPGVVESLRNPLTDTVLSALSDFNYDVLEAEVDYQYNGELLANFHIEGRSPNLENNRPVHLNINTEQNILSLLESLEYTNNLNGKLTKN